MSEIDPIGDTAAAEARKKKKSKHRGDADDADRKARKKKSQSQAEDPQDDAADADKKKKKKKHREDETPEEKEERRRRRREKKLAKQGAEGDEPDGDIPAIDDVADAHLPERSAEISQAPLADAGGQVAAEVTHVVRGDPPAAPAERRAAPPPTAPKPKPKPMPKPKPVQRQPEPEAPNVQYVQPEAPNVQYVQPEALNVQYVQPEAPNVQQHSESEAPFQPQPEAPRPYPAEPEARYQHREPEARTQRYELEPQQRYYQPEAPRQREAPYDNHYKPDRTYQPAVESELPQARHAEPAAAREGSALRDSEADRKDPALLHQYIADTLEDSDDELTPIEAPAVAGPGEPVGSNGIEVDVQVRHPEHPDQEHHDAEQRFSQMVEDDLTSRHSEQATPAEIPEGKKSGGLLGKLFASFRRGGSKRKQFPKKPGEAHPPPADAQPRLEEQGKWRSNPSMFNPNETPENTLDPGAVVPPQHQQPQPHQPPHPVPHPMQQQAHPPAVRAIPESEVRVILLDGEEISVPVGRKANGEELMAKVCEYIDLMETDYFGLTYVDSKERMWFWIDCEKKIFKQLKHCETRLLNFQVKFYPPEPNLLTADVTRYQLCLQVRQDIYTGKLPCTWVTQALLGSFQVQSELGDYDLSDHGDLGSIEYLQNFEFVHNQTPELVAKIAELHRGHKGLTPEVADLRYLETARRLEFYGVDLHPARDLDDVDITLGVCFGGVLVYKDRMRISRFAWPKILRISYRKNLFYLKIRSDMYENVEAVVGFKLMNHRWAKRLWKIAVENHAFFRLKEAQLQKTGSRASLNFMRGNSAHRFSGRTMYQYRTDGGAGAGTMRQSGTFDRSLTKRMSASLPSLKGSQYGSFHSLNRLHPRDMRPVTAQKHGGNPAGNPKVVARTGSVSMLPTTAFNRPPSRTPSTASDDLL